MTDITDITENVVVVGGSVETKTIYTEHKHPMGSNQLGYVVSFIDKMRTYASISYRA